VHGSNQRDGDEELEFRQRGRKGGGWWWETAGFETSEEEGFLVGFVCEEREDEGEDCEED